MPTDTDKGYLEQLVKMLSKGVASAVTKPKVGKRVWLSQTTHSAFPGLWGLNVGIMPRESWMVSGEEDDNNEIMAEGKDGDNEGAWMDEED